MTIIIVTLDDELWLVRVLPGLMIALMIDVWHRSTVQGRLRPVGFEPWPTGPVAVPSG